jgi:von Willebrand factor type A domain
MARALKPASTVHVFTVVATLTACACGSSDPGPASRARTASGAAAAGSGSGSLADANGGANPVDPTNAPPTATMPINKVGPSGSGTCDVIQLTAKPIIPDMMIVLDRSGSMEDGGRWMPSVNAVRSITMALQARIHFGLALFPDPTAGGNRGGGGGRGSSCAPGKVVVPVAADNATMIGSVLDMTKPGGGTPTSDTLDVIINDFANAPIGPDQQPSAKYVLLVTDGAPTCPAGMGQNTLQPDIDASNTAVEQLTMKGVRTYVIGYDTTGPGNEMLAQVLDGLAQRGGTGDQMHRPVEDEASLLAEFMRIAGVIASCQFQLNAPPQRADYVLVRLDGKQVNLNDPNGFQLIGDRTVELEGSACMAYQQGSHVLDAQVQCSVVQPM